MHDQHLQLELAALHRELREIALQRPRLDRPDPRTPGRVRSWLGDALDERPARAQPAGDGSLPDVVIRPAAVRDAPALRLLSEISERRLPSGLVLVGEVDATLVAAVPVDGGPPLADIRRATVDVTQMLRLRARQVRAAERRSRAA